MNTLFKENIESIFPLGTEIEGMWNGNKYKILKRLGQGENGIVYLVEKNKHYFALKINTASIDIAYEIQAIQRLNEAQGETLGFSIFDFDDLKKKDTVYSYYVMPYKAGVSINKYLNGKGFSDYIEVFKKVLYLLNKLHKVGFVFGDLKPEHIIINPSNQISLVDFGGVTLIGESVRQYTETFDRGAWKAGGRKADIHYDYFSLVMVIVSVAIGENKFKKLFNQTRSIYTVYDIIRNIVAIKPLAELFFHILTGKVLSYDHILNKLELQKEYTYKYSPIKWIDIVFTSSLLLFVFVFTFFWIIY